MKGKYSMKIAIVGNLINLVIFNKDITKRVSADKKNEVMWFDTIHVSKIKYMIKKSISYIWGGKILHIQKRKKV